MKKSTKRTHKVLNVFLAFIAGILLLSILWVIISQVLTAYEKSIYPAPGEMVTVSGRQMHVYTQGEGENTIVLTPGLGTTAPVLDFQPLIDELAKTNKVVVVEPFGYGWSDLTDNERTVENITEELRTALSVAGINGPYVLMPHSISGIYAMYYANTYPEEVKAIIGIDCTLPEMSAYFGESIPSMPSYLSALVPTGIARLLVLMMPNGFLPIDPTHIYSDENLKTTKVLSAWQAYNKNVVAEGNEIEKNIEKTSTMKFVKDLPVLIFAKEGTTPREDGKTTQSFYEMALAGLDNSQIVILEGHHYLHWTNYETMSNDVSQFLNSIKTNSSK
ncbi:alpha/beta fold hydrolase [Acetobacterium paludosum]|nr:alpha/beta hydrolase [Acetobacterium paludosum]